MLQFTSIKKIKILINSSLICFIINFFINKIIKVGIIGLPHSQNVGNNLLKYAIYIKLVELGFEPYIIGVMHNNNPNISFINNTIKIRIIKKNFSEIKKNDYDILMVNSDQTWRRFGTSFFYDVAFLEFSEKWQTPKFVYGASLGVDVWEYTKNEEIRIKKLITNFTGFSLREKGSIKHVEEHLGIKPLLVLDPTFLINKKYYLKIIKNFKIDNLVDNSFIFIYTLTNSFKLKNYIKNNIEKNNYKYYLIDINVPNHIEKFIYGIYKSKGVITDSYHGTIFSIIFNKPFISFVIKERGNERFNSLKYIFNISDRIFEIDSNPDINLLEKPLYINKSKYKYLKRESINFLKNHLRLKKI